MRVFMLAALLAVLPMQAQAQFWDGNRLGADMREWEKANAEHPDTSYYSVGRYTGYVLAATHAYEAAGLICTSTSVTQGQISAIVAAYLKANPKRWNELAISLVRGALTEGFPCG